MIGWKRNAQRSPDVAPIAAVSRTAEYPPHPSLSHDGRQGYDQSGNGSFRGDPSAGRGASHKFRPPERSPPMKKISPTALMIRGGFCILVLLVAAGVLRSRGLRVREERLREMARSIYDGSDLRGAGPKPRLVTSNVREILLRTSRQKGGVQSFRIQGVYVPFVGITDVVDVRTKRGGVAYSENLMSIGSVFNDLQITAPRDAPTEDR